MPNYVKYLFSERNPKRYLVHIIQLSFFPFVYGVGNDVHHHPVDQVVCSYGKRVFFCGRKCKHSSSKVAKGMQSSHSSVSPFVRASKAAKELMVGEKSEHARNAIYRSLPGMVL